MGDTAPRHSGWMYFFSISGAIAIALLIGWGVYAGGALLYDSGFEDGKASQGKMLSRAITIGDAAIFLAKHHGEMEKGTDRIVICERPKSPVSEFSYGTRNDPYSRDPIKCNTLAGERTITFPVTYDANGTPIIEDPVIDGN